MLPDCSGPVGGSLWEKTAPFKQHFFTFGARCKQGTFRRSTQFVWIISGGVSFTPGGRSSGRPAKPKSVQHELFSCLFPSLLLKMCGVVTVGLLSSVHISVLFNVRGSVWWQKSLIFSISNLSSAPGKWGKSPLPLSLALHFRMPCPLWCHIGPSQESDNMPSLVLLALQSSYSCNKVTVLAGSCFYSPFYLEVVNTGLNLHLRWAPLNNWIHKICQST